MARAELRAEGDPAPPTVAEILRDLRSAAGGRDVSCWCPKTVDCHRDVILAIAASWSALMAIGDIAIFPSGFRCERVRDESKRAERAYHSPTQRIRWPNWNR
ncbi:hypothetical protein ABE438_17295 [Bosea sp. TWI1241]|uniref:hypothetical protein n=1 Tax=Bosea sp. TWI1241 TaxID=3148904 RepID=UPI003208A121